MNDTTPALPPLPPHMIVDSQIAEWMRAYALQSIAADRAAREEPVARAVTGRDGWPNVVSYDKGHFERQEREFGTVAFYAAPPPAVEGEREAFERWASDEGQWPAAIERDGEGYRLATTQHAWIIWQARAALAARPSAPKT